MSQNKTQAKQRQDKMKMKQYLKERVLLSFDKSEGGVVTDYSHLLPQRSADESYNSEFQPLEGSQ